MRAYVLVAGYATRLYPLTRDLPKALLPVGGRPLLAHLFDRLLGLPELTEIVLVSNHRFAPAFQAFAAAARCRVPVRVLDDGSTREENRLGATGDLAFALERVPVGGAPFLVVAGDVAAERAIELARRAFAGWAPRKAPRLELAGPVRPVERTIVVVDRPNAAQSIVYFGHMTVARDDPDFAKLLVVNQILGGSAMARLPLDLGQRRGLAQGAYSALLERGQLAPLRAYAAVRTDKTLAAVAGIVEHLRRISSQPPSADELASAKRQLEGSFALRAETAAQVARLVARQRLHGLPDDCWDRFRAQIRAVTNEEALAAARAYVRPETMVLVVVGRATAIADALERWGPVAVLDTDGQLLRAARPVPPPPVPWN